MWHSKKKRIWKKNVHTNANDASKKKRRLPFKFEQFLFLSGNVSKVRKVRKKKKNIADECMQFVCIEQKNLHTI